MMDHGRNGVTLLQVPSKSETDRFVEVFGVTEAVAEERELE